MKSNQPPGFDIDLLYSQLLAKGPGAITRSDLASLYGFNHFIRFNLDNLTTRIMLGKASLIIIDGGLGEGKTTLAVECADYLNDDFIDFGTQLAMGGSQFQKKLDIGFKLGSKVIIYDEAGDFDKKGWITKFNKMLNRTFDTFRAFGIIVIIVLPCFAVLQQDIFDKQIPQFLFNCYDRHESYGRVRGFSLRRMLYIKNYMKTSVIRAQCYKDQIPNGRFLFHNLPKMRSDLLHLASTKSKVDQLQTNIKQDNGYLYIEEIASKVNKSESYIRTLFRPLKIDPIHKIKHKLCYPGDAIEKVEHYLKIKEDERRSKQMSYQTLK